MRTNEADDYFFVSSVFVVDVVSAGAVVAGGVVAVVSAGAGAGAIAGGATGAGAGVVVVVVVLVVSSFLPQAVREIASNDATSRVFFIVPSLGRVSAFRGARMRS